MDTTYSKRTNIRELSAYVRFGAHNPYVPKLLSFYPDGGPQDVILEMQNVISGDDFLDLKMGSPTSNPRLKSSAQMKHCY